ncbi:granzyme B(G,H)-like [Labrus mixtus]|uniref:granzyme B(G,H)-like n=1 Tax=Labrus mixtus TaxID=508554 RepID=UPI0029BFD4FC|nr:granzyme B(G,H)-like [Labrus mixtus]
MHIHARLAALMLVLTLDGQVHTGRIIGGRVAKAHSRPYMALVKYGLDRHCGGFLLNEDFVMTAAHCQDSSYTVLLGLHDAHNQREVQSISVEQSFPHKDFNEQDYSHDIMLLKLSSKVKLNDHVAPISMADRSKDSLPKSCSVSGWGRNNSSENMSVVLKEANVTLIQNKNCEKQNLYCSEGEPRPAEGDSGGPLVCEDGKAYGVVSTESYHLDGQVIVFYTKISDYGSWINANLKNA